MKILKKKAHLLLGGIILIGVLSCDKDFNTIGANFVSQDNFNTDVFVDTEISAVNKRLDQGVQTNGVPISLLGHYTDPVYGQTEGSIISQVALSQTSPDFGENPEIKQVIISIPYFSTLLSTDGDGASTYELDSIFGLDPVRLTMHRTSFFLRDFDPSSGFEDPQIYYSNDEGALNFESFRTDLIYENLSFYPSDEEIEIMELNDDTGEMEVSERFAPRLRVVFDREDTDPVAVAALDYWSATILDPSVQDNLVSQNAFQDYFRGVHVTTENISGNGHAIIVNSDQINIEIVYDFDAIDIADEDGDGDTTETFRDEGSLTVGFTPNRVNTFDNIFDPAIEAHIVNNDDDKLYLKGGEGSYAEIELFGADNDGDGEADQLTQLRANNWLINEANLIFYVDRATVQGGSSEPRRLYLYDLDNEAPLIDFFFNTTGQTAEVAANHLGILERDEFDKGIRYKMKLTEHIKNIVNKDSTNVKLGLVVSSAVDDFSLATIRDAAAPDVERIPNPSVYSPKGTVLFNHNATNEEKKLKLQIYYTEQDN
jgi:hypothetical protein